MAQRSFVRPLSPFNSILRDFTGAFRWKKKKKPTIKYSCTWITPAPNCAPPSLLFWTYFIILSTVQLAHTLVKFVSLSQASLLKTSWPRTNSNLIRDGNRSEGTRAFNIYARYRARIIIGKSFVRDFSDIDITSQTKCVYRVYVNMCDSFITLYNVFVKQSTAKRGIQKSKIWRYPISVVVTLRKSY